MDNEGNGAEAAARVAILMGSRSDLPMLEGCADTLAEFGIPFEMHVMSAHRTPDTVRQFASGAQARGLRVIIAAAGGAAHLAGVVAAYTTLPVIAVPIPTELVGGLDSLLSTIQMPGGVPVASMGLGKAGARNAALMAAKILATADESLRRALGEHSARMAESVRTQDRSVQKWLQERAGN